MPLRRLTDWLAGWMDGWLADLVVNHHHRALAYGRTGTYVLAGIIAGLLIAKERVNLSTVVKRCVAIMQPQVMGRKTLVDKVRSSGVPAYRGRVWCSCSVS